MIKINAIVLHTSACPTQWYGETEDKEVIYFRYRWGGLSYGIGKDKDEAVHNSVTAGVKIIGDAFDGELAYEELKNTLKDAFIFPELENDYERFKEEEPYAQ